MTQQPNPLTQASVAQTLGIDEVRTSSRVWRWLIAGAGIVAALLAIAATLYFTGGDQTTYQADAVRRGDLTVTVTATGNLEPTNQVDVGIEVSGTIKTVDADYNDLVKTGQVLARLDTSKLEAQVAQSAAALEAARAKVSQAQATVEETANKYQRVLNIRVTKGNEYVSDEDVGTAKANVERAKADEASARASVSQADAALKQYRTDLSKAVVHSPINGIIIKRSVEPGQTVAASLSAPTLFTVAEDLTKMELHVDVDEADVGKIRVGQEAAFTVAAHPDKDFPAKVTQVRYGSTTVSGVVTYTTVLQVDNPDLSLRPGMTATAIMTVQKLSNVLLVPNAALSFEPPKDERAAAASSSLISHLMFRMPRNTSSVSNSKQQRVWMLHDSTPQAIDVAVLASDGNMSAIADGALQAGMTVITDAVQKKR